MRIGIIIWLVWLNQGLAAPSLPIDKEATPETRKLFADLHRNSGQIRFGHQDTAAYGIGWRGENERSDIKDACGRWPAVYGWDLGDIHKTHNLDGVRFSDMKRWIIAADARGGINTLSIHLDNPISGGSAHDNRPAVEHILPGGLAHEVFLQTLDEIASFLRALKRKDGKAIPVVLRPFHEHNQSWPWWGRQSCLESDFIALWRMTVRHLRDTRGIHNVIYAYSPQDVTSEREYLFGYPGDEFVDVFGLDYYRAWHWRQVPQMGQSLSMLNRLADKHGKIAALTEAGVDKVPNADWWTEYLLKALKHDEWSRRTRWVLVWRNKSRGHHFGPFPGHLSAKDFVNFSQDPLMRFGQKDD